MSQLLSLRAATMEGRTPRACVVQREATAISLRAATRESPRAATKTQRSQK